MDIPRLFFRNRQRCVCSRRLVGAETSKRTIAWFACRSNSHSAAPRRAVPSAHHFHINSFRASRRTVASVVALRRVAIVVMDVIVAHVDEFHLTRGSTEIESSRSGAVAFVRRRDDARLTNQVQCLAASLDVMPPTHSLEPRSLWRSGFSNLSQNNKQSVCLSVCLLETLMPS